MPPYASESAVRLRFQLTDETRTPPDLLAACLEEAHDIVTRFLGPDAPSSPPEPVVLAETLLAGAAAFRALQAACAQEHPRLTMGDQTIDDASRPRNLAGVADAAVELAWRLLEPYGPETPPRAPGDATTTQPILGEASLCP